MRILSISLLSFLFVIPIFGQVDLPYERIVLNEKDDDYGYYIALVPDTIKGTLVLFPGFGQPMESIIMDTDFPKECYENKLLTILFAGRRRMTADSWIQVKLGAVLKDAQERYQFDPNKVVMGGFSAGGTIALRYTQLCYQYEGQYPVLPVGVFMGDSPIDLYHLWAMQEANLKPGNSAISIEEAKFIGTELRNAYGGTPGEDPRRYGNLSPFSLDSTWLSHEKWLTDVAVRTYHDVDINWRLKNRGQGVYYRNYVPAAELIKRLLDLGNERAEFMQTFQTGYRRNGDRHPHSWSIIDVPECVQWIKGLVEE